MSCRIVTRDDVAQKLSDWMAGRISAPEVHAWAESLYLHEDVRYADCESDERSVTNEILAALDMLDLNLLLPQDVPILLEFLHTPSGQFHIGYSAMSERLDEIDFGRRAVVLRDVEPYASVLKNKRN